MQSITLKDINAAKKRLNWGDIPPFYHMIANAVADLEGIHTHGFDHPLKRLIDRQNWNLQRLNGVTDEQGQIRVERKPKVHLFCGFYGGDYQVQCAPISDGGPVFVYTKGDPFIDFKVWDPGTMRSVFRLPQFKEFIVFGLTRGDEADSMLINYAAQLIDSLLHRLEKDIEIEQRRGQSLQDIIEEVSNAAKT